MSFAFGSRKFGEGVYGGYADLFSATAIPVIVELYDILGARRSTFQTGCGDFLGCEFINDESGCKSFTLYFAKAQDIEKAETIKIKIFGSIDNFFTGVIREIPKDGSTEQKFNYSGYGLNDYLLRINAESLSYAADTIADILDDLLDNVITVKTPIVKNISKLNPPNITIAGFNINHAQIPEVLESLKNIAASDGNQYLVGVDQEGEFFFRPRSTETKVTLVMGARGLYGIDKYEPQENYEARTKYFVLDKDGTYITTISSALDNDIYEEKLTAPDIDAADIANWAQGILTENETATRSASIQWKIEEIDPMPLFADGYLRVLSNIPPDSSDAPSPNPYGSGTYGSGLYGGGQSEWKYLDDTLKIVEVGYVLNGSQSVRNIQLGNKPVRLDEEILKIRKKLLNLEISLGV